MASQALKDIDLMIPWLIQRENMWSHFDREADVLYLHFKKPNHADDSELTDDDIIIRYEKGEVVGLTVMNVSLRMTGEIGLEAPLNNLPVQMQV